jgi:tRNA threonylcarbamoyladenosine biosynthesis protein TsaB
VKILAADTALGACSVAVLEDDTLRAHLFEPMERGHAERLAPMVRDVMAAAGESFGAIDRLAVTVGPGTFTGQRVGYAFMRGMRLALQRPLVGITTLAAMAGAAQAQTGLSPAVVLHDARRGEVYVTGLVGRKTVVEVQLAAFDEAIRMICDAFHAGSGVIAVAGTAGERAVARFHGAGRQAVDTAIHSPDAAWVGRLARLEPEPSHVPPPLYLRPPDAKLPTQGIA